MDVLILIIENMIGTLILSRINSTK